MKKIGLIYSFNTKNSAEAAKKIAGFFEETQIDEINAEEVNEKQFLSYDNLILSAPTWFDGELPNYWDEFIPALDDLDLKGKTIAIFGMADQKGYPQNFADAVGILAGILEEQGASIIGEWPDEGYEYETSKALRGDKFAGLILDKENQDDLTDSRIEKWVKQLKKTFK